MFAHGLHFLGEQMSSDSLTDEYLERLFELDDSLEDGIPQELDKQVRRCLVDYLGVTFFGSTIQSGHIAQLRSWVGKGDVPVLGTDLMCDSQGAAFLMALLAHSAELDDGHRKGMVHPGAAVFSALYAVLPRAQRTWGDFCRAVVLGYEATVLLSELVQPSHKTAGFHATATCGAAGAAISVVSYLGIQRDLWRDALGAALSGTNGLLETMNKESELKPVNAARAAMLGVNSSMLAASGFRGPCDILGGDRGFIACMTTLDVSKVTITENVKPRIMGVYFKPYSSCRHCHPGVEAAIRIFKRPGFSFEKVSSVEVETYQLAIKGHVEKDVTTVSAAKMSIPVSVVLALATGSGDKFDDVLLHDASIRRVVTSTKVVARDDLSALVPQKRAAIVSVWTEDGLFGRERVDYPKGEPENPMELREIEEKYIGCVSKSPAISISKAIELFDGVMSIKDTEQVNPLIKIICKNSGVKQ